MKNVSRIQINSGDVSDFEELDDLKETVNSRESETHEMLISLEHTGDMNLSSFNALIRLYMEQKRKGRKITYINCQHDRLVNLIHKTQFDHVFVCN